MTQALELQVVPTRWMDRSLEILARRLARRTSRRHFLSRLGRVVLGGALLPLLPVDRSGGKQAFAAQAQGDDSTRCDYWRYCAIDGYLCSCCGGAPNVCPPGSHPSPTAWVGSCINPEDGETYLLAYRDCCGKDSCGRCACLNTEGEMPVYRPELNNDIVWCFGAPSMVYHCSSAALVGRVG